MKFAFIIFGYFEFGGLSKSFYNILNATLKAGHDVTVLTMDWRGPKPDVEQGFTVQLIPQKGFSNHAKIIHFNKRIGSHLNNTHYDLIVGFNRLEGLDVYYAGDVCYANYIENGKHPISKFLTKMTPRYKALKRMESSIFADPARTKVLAISRREKQIYQSMYQTAENNFFELPPGIIKTPFEKHDSTAIANIKGRFDLRDNEKTLLMVGSKFKWKGVHRAIKALPYLKQQGINAKLIIAGEGESKSLIRMASRLNVKDAVLFVGPQRDIASIMHASNLFLHLALHENTGNVIIEALISGLPAIVTDTCGYAHYVTDAHAGIEVSNTPFNQHTFNQTLASVLKDQNQLDQWSLNAETFCKSADLSSRIEKVVSLFESEAKKQR